MTQTVNGNQLKVHCWGVRGSVPTPDKDKMEVGGNTACIALRFNREPLVIIDAGTGLRSLATHLEENGDDSLQASILFSHFHWDHIQGLPFFSPLYSERTALQMYSAIPTSALQEVLESQMKEPYFPVPFSAVRASCEYLQITPEGWEIGSMKVRPVSLNHPGGACGYRIDTPAGSLIYVSDHEHGVDEVDSAIADTAEGADLLIYDAHFTPAEYPPFRGWGHSTWLAGTELANRAEVRELLLFHHKPSRRDREFVTILAEARNEFARTDAAHERRSLCLTKP